MMPQENEHDASLMIEVLNQLHSTMTSLQHFNNCDEIHPFLLSMDSALSVSEGKSVPIPFCNAIRFIVQLLFLFLNLQQKKKYSEDVGIK
jgi:hypothetical protein